VAVDVDVSVVVVGEVMVEVAVEVMVVGTVEVMVEVVVCVDVKVVVDCGTFTNKFQHQPERLGIVNGSPCTT
jgi:hypothetical protein